MFDEIILVLDVSSTDSIGSLGLCLIFQLLLKPGLAISIDDSGIVCKEEGFHPHPTTCAKFYRCVRWSGELELVSCRWMQIEYGCVSSLANQRNGEIKIVKLLAVH